MILLPKASLVYEWKADVTGYVSHIACDEVGICSLLLGGGRETKESSIDLSVGLVLHKKVGDAVSLGDTVAVLYANDADRLAQAKERLRGAYVFSDTAPERKELIRGTVR